MGNKVERKAKVSTVGVEKRWLTVEELEAYLGFGNMATQREWRDNGLLPYYRLGRVIVYDKNEIDDFVRKHKQIDVQNETFRTSIGG